MFPAPLSIGASWFRRRCAKAGPILVAFTTLISAPGWALQPDQIFDRVAPSVVLVLATNQKSLNQGSGVVVAPQRVVTNCHVVDKHPQVTVKWRELQLPATIEIADAARDLCLLSVAGLPAPAATTRRLSSIRVGQRVFAIGNPEGLELTLTEGLVSAIRTVRGDKTIQTSAPVSHGSSGGGLFDDDGKLIAVTSSGIKEGLGLNFAIPVDYVIELGARAQQAAAAKAPSLVDKSAHKNSSTETTIATLSASSAPKNEVTFPRVLNGVEIAEHYQRNSKLNIEHKGRSFRLTVSSQKWLHRYCSGCNSTSGSGRLRIDSSRALVCFDWNNLRYPDGGCYQLIQTDERNFVLSDKTGVSMKYSVAP